MPTYINFVEIFHYTTWIRKIFSVYDYRSCFIKHSITTKSDKRISRIDEEKSVTRYNKYICILPVICKVSLLKFFFNKINQHFNIFGLFKILITWFCFKDKNNISMFWNIFSFKSYKISFFYFGSCVCITPTIKK